MYLSAFSQYTLRNLLSEHFSRFNLTVAYKLTPSAYSQKNLSQLLSELSVDANSEAKIEQLETLLRVYQSFRTGKILNPDELETIKHKIFQLLEVPQPATCPTKMPTVLAEDVITPFNFFYGGQIR
jgi:DNA mismatch repair ATPase MutL